MTIIQYPSSITLSGNIQDILIEDVLSPVNFSLYHPSLGLIIKEIYYADTNKKIRIRLKDIIHSMLYLIVPSYQVSITDQSAAYSTYTAEISEITNETIQFTVVKGLLQRAQFDVENFLRFNWLTTQPLRKPINFHDPEWLTCHPLEEVVVKVKGYLKNGTVEEVANGTLEANKTQTVKVNPGEIYGLFTEELEKYEIYTEASGQRRQQIQTYIPINERGNLQDDIFVFENRIGGIDTIRFSGERIWQDSTLIEIALFDEFMEDYFTEGELSVKKNTGYLGTDEMRKHALDFFRSPRKHHLLRGNLERIILEKPSLESVKGELNNFIFNFRYSDPVNVYPEIAIPPLMLE